MNEMSVYRLLVIATACLVVIVIYLFGDNLQQRLTKRRMAKQPKPNLSKIEVELAVSGLDQFEADIQRATDSLERLAALSEKVALPFCEAQEDEPPERTSYRKAMGFLRRTIGSGLWLDSLEDDDWCILWDEIAPPLIKQAAMREDIEWRGCHYSKGTSELG